MRWLTLFVLAAVLLLPFAQAANKEDDLDVNYEENRVPRYVLPQLLVTSEGTSVTTPDEWFRVRRPQILSLFSNLVYGRIPKPECPVEVTYAVRTVDADFMKGRATRKEVRIRFSNDRGRAESRILVFSPNEVASPAPALMLHSFESTTSRGFRENSDDPDRLRNGWHLGRLLEKGLGLVVVYQQDLVGHNEVEFNRGIAPLFYREGQSFPDANEWGVLSMVAWGGMRALDYLETDDAIDATRIAIMGHSKMGKAALWTAAQDTRFAAAVSAQSGCAGAALWRRRSGETLSKMVTRFPYWLCRNAWKFAGQEDDLPVDQHMLLALIAPRPVYVYSGEGDRWADPRGEYLSAYHASAVYRLLGKTGLSAEESPALGEPILESDVGYHVRAGGHSVDDYDWQQVVKFLSAHL